MKGRGVPEVPPEPTQRLDKWLWAARFFKTRQLAVEAINGGKIQVDGQRAKPGRNLKPGVELSIHKGPLEWRVRVLALDPQRRGAPQAAALYAEDEESQRHRAERIAEQRAAGAFQGATSERPTKRDRRQIQRFTSTDDH